MCFQVFFGYWVNSCWPKNFSIGLLKLNSTVQWTVFENKLIFEIVSLSSSIFDAEGNIGLLTNIFRLGFQTRILHVGRNVLRKTFFLLRTLIVSIFARIWSKTFLLSDELLSEVRLNQCSNFQTVFWGKLFVEKIEILTAFRILSQIIWVFWQNLFNSILKTWFYV